jgi:hypothetical protein
MNSDRVRVEQSPDEVVVRIPRLANVLRRFLPEEAVQHLQAAQREQLLAMRSIIDAAIERLEDSEREAKTPRRTEIPVE